MVALYLVRVLKGYPKRKSGEYVTSIFPLLFSRKLKEAIPIPADFLKLLQRKEGPEIFGGRNFRFIRVKEQWM